MALKVHCPADLVPTLTKHTWTTFKKLQSGEFDQGWSWSLQDSGPQGPKLPTLGPNSAGRWPSRSRIGHPKSYTLCFLFYESTDLNSRLENLCPCFKRQFLCIYV